MPAAAFGYGNVVFGPEYPFIWDRVSILRRSLPGRVRELTVPRLLWVRRCVRTR